MPRSGAVGAGDPFHRPCETERKSAVRDWDPGVVARERRRRRDVCQSHLGVVLLAGQLHAVGSYIDYGNDLGPVYPRQGLLVTEFAGVWATGVEAVVPACPRSRFSPQG